MARDHWQMAGGRWPVADGRWPMAGGRWPVVGARWAATMAARAARRHTHGQCCQTKTDIRQYKLKGYGRSTFPLSTAMARGWDQIVPHSAQPSAVSVPFGASNEGESRTGVTRSHELSRVFRQFATEIFKCVRFGFGKRPVRDANDQSHSVHNASQTVPHQQGTSTHRSLESRRRTDTHTTQD